MLILSVDQKSVAMGVVISPTMVLLVSASVSVVLATLVGITVTIIIVLILPLIITPLVVLQMRVVVMLHLVSDLLSIQWIVGVERINILVV
jgi:hypothetical protein